MSKRKRETSDEGDEKKHLTFSFRDGKKHQKEGKKEGEDDLQFIERALANSFQDLDEIYDAMMREYKALGADSRVERMNEDCTWLDRAAFAGHVKLVKMLIKYGDDVNDVQCLGNKSALHYAAWRGGVEVVNVLIQNGADVNALDYQNENPLHLACYGQPGVVNVLIQAGADVNNRSSSETGSTPLLIATDEGKVNIMKALIQNGADVNAVNNYGDGVIHQCVFVKFEAVEVMIQAGVDINSLDRDGRTLLNCYSLFDKVPEMLRLLCLGAELSSRAIFEDKSHLLRPINDRLNLLRNGNRMGTTLMSDEEGRFMWDLAFFLTMKHGGATAFKTYRSISSFITFHGIFMANGYYLGDDTIWKRTMKKVEEVDEDGLKSEFTLHYGCETLEESIEYDMNLRNMRNSTQTAGL